MAVALRLVGTLGWVGLATACGSPSDGANALDRAEPAQAVGAPLTGLTLSSIALFQGPKATLVRDGAVVAAPNAPVIGERPGLLRVYVTPGAGWTARNVTAELRLTGAAQEKIVDDQVTVSVASDDATPGSAFDFPLTSFDLIAGTQVTVTLRDESGATSTYPRDGSTVDLGAVDGMQMKVFVVPVEYDADGSGRVSDTSPAAVQTLQNAIYSTFPTSNVDVIVRDHPLPFAEPLDADTGAGWDDLYTAVAAVRATDQILDDVYIIGLVNPASSYSVYCGASCVAGQDPTDPAPADFTKRSMVMLGFPDYVVGGAPYNLAVTLGRLNAPCGSAVRPDPSFPYAGGRTTDVGYDVLGSTFVPGGYADITSTCTPTWVSDYTFAGLATQIGIVNGL